jgi:hypothetical protein
VKPVAGQISGRSRHFTPIPCLFHQDGSQGCFVAAGEIRRSPVGGMAVAGLRYHALWRDTLRQSALGNELRSSDHVDLVNRALSPQSSLIYWFLAWASGCATGGGASLRLDAHSGLFYPRGQRGRRSWSGLRSRPRGQSGHEDLGRA